jgi:hypothetical protein
VIKTVLFDTLAATLNQMRTRLNDEFTARHQAADQLQQERNAVQISTFLTDYS